MKFWGRRANLETKGNDINDSSSDEKQSNGAVEIGSQDHDKVDITSPK
jgi:hypothetical protein